MNNQFKFLLLLSLSLCCFTSTFAVSIPSIFSSQMVLQQQSDVKFWGWGKPFEKINITTSWKTEVDSVTVDKYGKWAIHVTTPQAGMKAHTIKIQGYNSIILEDVLVGEVWLCSGQSNMEWTASSGINNAKEEIKNANYPEIRFFRVPFKTADSRQNDLQGNWKQCTPESMKHFSAVAYFFAREVQGKLGIPIGLIDSSWGGTPAEVWINSKVIQENKVLSEAAKKLKDEPWAPQKLGVIFNAMITPIIPFKIAGVLWYQGETNTSNPNTYDQLLSTLIQNWRAEWEDEFPFYFAQIAPFKNYGGQSGVLLRDAQRKVKVANTGMVVTSDIGNLGNIHPKNKQDVGKRFANWALNKTYGIDSIAFSGPLYEKMEIEGKKIRLYFEYAESGLVSKGEELIEFQIAGEDMKFVDAQAKIDEKTNTILVSAKGVKEPKAVRFGWSNTSNPNLFNGVGLPASCFRTDDWAVE